MVEDDKHLNDGMIDFCGMWLYYIRSTTEVEKWDDAETPQTNCISLVHWNLCSHNIPLDSRYLHIYGYNQTIYSKSTQRDGKDSLPPITRKMLFGLVCPMNHFVGNSFLFYITLFWIWIDNQYGLHRSIGFGVPVLDRPTTSGIHAKNEGKVEVKASCKDQVSLAAY